MVARQDDEKVTVGEGGNRLMRLIAQRRDEKRLSYGDIARVGGLPKSTVHKLATTEVWSTAPHPETLDRLARGLGLPPATVRKAASEATGLTRYQEEVTADEGVQVLIGSIEALTPEQRAQVAALVDAMLANG